MKQSSVFWIVIVVVVIAAGVIGAAIQYSSSPAKNNQAANSATQTQVQTGAQTQTNTNTNMDTELKIEDVKVGTGPAAKTGDSVTVHYTGTFADGKKFDSSLDRGEPFTFTLGGQVIQGWNEGVVGMQVGGTRKLVIPPALGYGPNDYGPIPGNSTLYFTIELLKLNS